MRRGAPSRRRSRCGRSGAPGGIRPDGGRPVPESPVSCGDHYQQGDGTYHYVNYGEDDDAVLISTLGPFATGDRGGSSGEAREALESAGFRWIDEATSDITVTDLCVYYFGDRKPLSVGTLLFYWQG
ncbi:hypothetical protein ACTMTU_08440 [Streptomyces sp. OZ13]|uniref:hypothetical protein n=1 Tax=Streptomyces sp. OZ13 TaxID=3452210 RepID=UPI003F8C3ABF